MGQLLSVKVFITAMLQAKSLYLIAILNVGLFARTDIRDEVKEEIKHQVKKELESVLGQLVDKLTSKLQVYMLGYSFSLNVYVIFTLKQFSTRGNIVFKSI